MSRFFVNVYHPADQNCGHRTLDSAINGKDRSSSVETVEIEADFESIGKLEAECGDFSAEGLRAHYPIPVPPTTLKVIVEKASDAVTVGDLNSSARGTGARKSSGKPDWSQIPWWVIPYIFRAWKDGRMRERSEGVYRVIELMADWQRGKDNALDEAAALLLENIHAPEGRKGSVVEGTLGWFPLRALESTVRVLEFGAKKYAKGNWAKGMSWSVCFTCTMSHLSKAFQGEENDEESGINHLAHAMCNMLFLLGYRDLYPEGDDRLTEFHPAGVKS